MSLNTFINVECSKDIFISYYLDFENGILKKLVFFEKKGLNIEYFYNFDWDCLSNELIIRSKRVIKKHHPKFNFFNKSRFIESKRTTYKKYRKEFEEWANSDKESNNNTNAVIRTGKLELAGP